MEDFNKQTLLKIIECEKLIVILKNLSDSDNSIRKASEEIMARILDGEIREKCLINLSLILADESIDINNRLLAALLIKNSIVKHSTGLINVELVLNIKASLASQAQTVRKFAGVILGKISICEYKYSWPPEIIQLLCQVALSNSSESIQYYSLETLNILLEEFALEENIRNLDNTKFINFIANTLLNLVEGEISEKKTNMYILVIKCVESLIIFIKSEEFSNEIKQLYDNIFNIAFFFVTKNLEVLSIIIQIFIYSTEKFYQIFSEFEYDKMINITTKLFDSYFKNQINSDEKLLLLILEVWCRLGDIELEYFRRPYPLVENKSKHIIRKKSNELYYMCLDIMKAKKKIENDSWDTLKASAYILCLIVQLNESPYLEKLMVFSEDNQFDDNEHIRYISLISLSCCLDAFSKEKLKIMIQSNIKNLIKSLCDPSELVSNTSSWVISKISKVCPLVFDKESLSIYLIPFLKIIRDGSDGGAFLEGFEKENYTAINRSYSNECKLNICNVVYNMVKFNSKNKELVQNNPISHYYFIILNDCLFTVFNIDNIKLKQYSLVATCFDVMNSVIDGSSLDFQDKIEVVLKQYVDILAQLNNDFGNSFDIRSSIITRFSKNVDIENEMKNINQLYEFYSLVQEYLCTFLEKIFIKIIRNVNKDVCLSVYDNIIISFQIRGVYETGLSCISHIVISRYFLILDLQEDFLPKLDEFFGYLTICLKSSEHIELYKAGIIIISSLIHSISLNCRNFISEIIPNLLNILCGSEVCQELKPFSISLLGDICFFIPELLIKEENFLNQIMLILLSASEASLNSVEDKDFLVDLKLTIVECWTSIYHGIKEISIVSEKIKIQFNSYIANIIQCLEAFMSNILKENNYQEEELNVAIISLICDFFESGFLSQVDKKYLSNRESVKLALLRIKQADSKKINSSMDWINTQLLNIN